MGTIRAGDALESARKEGEGSQIGEGVTYLSASSQQTRKKKKEPARREVERVPRSAKPSKPNQ